MELVQDAATRERTDTQQRACDALDHLLRTALLVRTQFSEFLEHYSLTEVRYSALAALRIAGRGGLSQAELAERLLQSESNISTLSDRMQQDGLVDRLRSEADRRKRVLLLSLAGQVLLDRVEAGRRVWALHVMRGVTPIERQTLLNLAKRLGDVLSGQTSTTGPTTKTPTAETSVHQPARWVESRLDHADETQSPHIALQQMLSSLGLANQLGEVEQ